MIFIWIANTIAFVYGMMSVIAGIVQFNKKEIPRWSALGFVLAGLILPISALYIVKIPNLIFVIIVCLLVLHILAIINGFYLHGKLNIRHHIFRFTLSMLMILFYIL
ncbi:hypothetical protein [Fredinandcohnia quinoae]|uniref:Uncharacterized protein n=1 Tax=Fredinandcohnia quinoae TaxID=2918902 RepID=A0AAW5E5G4_9BACI|nr:hypothetical protein [Fredinandcohnia sp. SECRCQ15]MCH1624850.1 hypothetical protein [Fredinandcohnia sp. SECRCQ15]